MAIKNFLDLDGLTFLVSQLVNLIEQRIGVRITTTINEESTNLTIPGTAAVYSFLTEAIKNIDGVRFERVPNLPAQGDPNVIYLIRIPGTQDRYEMWVYTINEWILLGSTDIDLADYWSKTDLIPITNQQIQNVVDSAMP